MGLFLAFWLCDVMDPESRTQFQLDNTGSELLSWEELSKFLVTRSRTPETTGVKMISTTHQTQPPRETRAQVYTAFTTCTQNCTKEHKLHACPQSQEMSISGKLRCVKTIYACLNCLQSGHSASKRPSKFTCRECRQRHHTLFYPPIRGNQDKKEGQQDSPEIFQTRLQKRPQNGDLIKLHRDFAMLMYQSITCYNPLLLCQSMTPLAKL